jgi:hypothetical protein
MSPEVSPLALRAIGGPFFIIGGSLLILMSAVGAAPSMWYFFCYCALPLVGIVWLWRPSLAAALSIGPLISLVALTQYVPGMWAFSRIWAVSVIAGLITASALVVGALHGFRKWQLPIVLSLAFATSAFATDRLFTNKTSIHSYQMNVAINGHAPWGDVGPQWSGDSLPIVLYRRLGDSYCYDAFKSEELRQRLSSKDRRTVEVEYNVFSDFGKERSYNVRSVDGLLLNEGQRTVRDFERFGGQILGSTSTSANGLDNCR